MRELAEKIGEELEERQKEMEECDHESISRKEDYSEVENHVWHCEECGMAFEPMKMESFDPKIKIRKHNCSLTDC